MCQYCTLRNRDAWAALLEYDDVYQQAVGGTSTATYGFHEDWETLREDVGYA